jgi:hypothetical protein
MPCLVGGGQRVGDLRAERERLLQRQRPALQESRRERLARRAAPSREGRAPVLIADVVERADVRVVQAAMVFASRSKRARRSGSAETDGGQHLDGDDAIEARVAGAW